MSRIAREYGDFSCQAVRRACGSIPDWAQIVKNEVEAQPFFLFGVKGGRAVSPGVNAARA